MYFFAAARYCINRNARWFTLFGLFGLFIGLVGVTPPHTSAAPLIPAESVLNADGTLNTTNRVNGAVNLSGWNVTLDAMRGPVFTPEGQAPNAPAGFYWDSLGSGVGNIVTAVAVSGTDVYVGGTFTACGGSSGCNRVAKWDGNSWSMLGTGVAGLGNAVYSLAVSGSDVYVGGTFNACGGISGCSNIAKWNGSSWSTLGTGVDNTVYALAASGTDLYVGGDFTTCGGTSNCNGIAKWNGSSWSTLGTGVNSTVKALAMSGTDLYVGGQFSTCGGTSNCNAVAKWSTTGGSWSTLGAGVGGVVNALAVSGTDLYAGGSISTCGGTSGCNNVAKWNGSSWSALGTGIGLNAVYALAASGTDLYVGGDFTTCGGISGCNHIAQWSITDSAWTTLGTGMNNGVNALTWSGTDLYVGGQFTTCGFGGCNRVGRWKNRVGFCSSKANGDWNKVATWDCGTVPQSGDTAYIANGHTVTLNMDTVDLGSVIIASGGTLTNNGAEHTVSLTGDWNRSGTVTPSTFIDVTFKGTGTQTLTGDTTFNNLAINSGATLDVSSYTVTINGTLTNDGVLKRTTPAQTVSNGGGTFAFTDGRGFKTLELTSTGNSSPGDTTLVLAANETPGACGSTFITVPTVKRTFNITPTTNTNIAMTVRLYFAPSELNGQTTNTLKVYHCNGTQWQQLSGTPTYGTDGTTGYPYVELAGVTAFSPFALGPAGGAPTAATLTGFDAKLTPKGAVRLKWTTGSELNLVGFNVWRRVGKGEWVKLNSELIAAKHIGTVAGDTYSRQDKKTNAGKTYYYKIELVHADRQCEWSPVRRVKLP